MVICEVSSENLLKQRNEQRYKYILDVAEKLFFLKNYDDVSMNDIAKEVGLNKATIYRYFKNKESLYFAIVMRGINIFNEIFKSKVKLGNTGLEKLEETGEAYFEFYKSYPDYHDAYLYSKSKRFEMKEIDYASEIDSVVKGITKTICDAIQDGIDDGSMRKDLNPMQVAVFIALTAERIVKLSPSTLNVLESQGINHEKFIEDSMNLWRHMVMNFPEET